jgi:2-phospho-L-lactate guanylyltransferase (CobY/MobA/RfbA family)
MSRPTHALRPTLLVFTLGASSERLYRRLLPGRLGDVETAFHGACLDAALDAGRAAGCRLVVATGAAVDLPVDVTRVVQRGQSFGVRFRHAVAEAEAAADGPLLVVGTDIPDLSAAHLRDALGRLAAAPSQVVVGPSPDGGFYLLGAATPLAGLLDGVHWRWHDTLHSLRTNLARHGMGASLLEPLDDLDHPRDLARWLSGQQAERRHPRFDHPSAFLSWPPRLIAWAVTLRRALASLAKPPTPLVLGHACASMPKVLGGRAPPR